MSFIRNPKDFWAGLLFIGLGIAAIVVGSRYNLGTAARMGPGYFPRILGLLLLLLGAIIAVRGMRTLGEPVPRWKWRPTLVVLLSVVGFGLIMAKVGMAISTVLLILAASAASHEFRPKEALIAGVLLAALSVGVFIVALHVQLPIWPEFSPLNGAAMDLLGHLALGFGVALSPINLLYALAGTLIGTLIGVLPGIGPVATIAMLLPTTYALPPVSALIMLAGIYYGAQYGGSTTAILLNMPGESSSVVTCLDGHQMALKGQAGAALATSAMASFFAGTVATVLIAGVSVPLSELALKFGPAEYFSLMVLGLIGAVVLASGSLLKAIAMIITGLLLGIVGTDVNSGTQRFAFGIPELSDGIGVVGVAMGLFGFAEIITNLESTMKRELVTSKVSGLWITKEQFKAAWPAVLRGTGIGSCLGILPGGGAMLSSFASYTVEKKIADDPSRFGKGAIQGVAGPESANNAGAQTSFIPLLTLGIPENAVMAMMVGAMTIHNIQPGPQVMTSNPGLFWGLIASMWVGNLMLVVLNLPMIHIWVKLLTVPYRMLYPAILLFCAIGVYTVNNTYMDVMLTAFFGLIGVLFMKLGCEPAPLLLGFVLGPMMEENLRRAMLLSRGDPTTFLTRPISAGMLIAAVLLVLIIALPNMRKKRQEAFQEEA